MNADAPCSWLDLLAWLPSAVLRDRLVVFVREDAMAAPDRLAEFLFRPNLPYIAGACFSCGDVLADRVYGRCSLCSFAWKLATNLPVHPDLARARDSAKIVG